MLTLTYTPSSGAILVTSGRLWAGAKNAITLINAEHADTPVSAANMQLTVKRDNRPTRTSFVSHNTWVGAAATLTATINFNVATLNTYLGQRDKRPIELELRDLAADEIRGHAQLFDIFRSTYSSADVADEATTTLRAQVLAILADCPQDVTYQAGFGPVVESWDSGDPLRLGAYDGGPVGSEDAS